MYRDIPAELLRVIEPIVCDHGLEIVDGAVLRGKGRTRVRVTVDTQVGDGRVLVDECAAVSREIGHGLASTARMCEFSKTISADKPRGHATVTSRPNTHKTRNMETSRL